MPTTTRYPRALRIPVTDRTLTGLKALASSRNLTVAEIVRRVIDAEIEDDAARYGVAVMEATLTRVLREELSPIRNIAFRGAFNAVLVSRLLRALTKMWYPKEAGTLWADSRVKTTEQMRRKLDAGTAGDNDG